jgi:SpoVK/Ycf46/Vps4 family AAA+-type ATPase
MIFSIKPLETPLLANARSWATDSGFFWPSPETVPTLPPGIYAPTIQNNMALLVQSAVKFDDIISLPESPTNELMTEIKLFWQRKEVYHSNGFIHKRGIILYGPPGTGKTSAIFSLGNELIRDHNAIIIYGEHPGLLTTILRQIKRLEASRSIVVVLEDFDRILSEQGVGAYLSLLDGESQVDGICFIATTNNKDAIDPRFIGRPSRFDRLIEVGYPSLLDRETYIKVKFPNLAPELVEDLVSNTDGYSMADLREMVVYTICLGNTVQQAISRLRQYKENSPVPHWKAKPLGFNS